MTPTRLRVSVASQPHLPGKYPKLLKNFGAGDRFRTDDLVLGKHTLYQLSYTRSLLERAGIKDLSAQSARVNSASRNLARVLLHPLQSRDLLAHSRADLPRDCALPTGSAVAGEVGFSRLSTVQEAGWWVTTVTT
jgi:hypothetical protein